MLIRTSGWPYIPLSTQLGTPSTNGDRIQPGVRYEKAHPAKYLCADHVHTATAPLGWRSTSRTWLAGNPDGQGAGVSSLPSGSQSPRVCWLQAENDVESNRRSLYHFTWGVLGPLQKPHKQGDILLYEPLAGSP